MVGDAITVDALNTTVGDRHLKRDPFLDTDQKGEVRGGSNQRELGSASVPGPSSFLRSPPIQGGDEGGIDNGTGEEVARGSFAL